MDKEDIGKAFENVFRSRPEVIVSSPGRINLIGEHIDYNGGLVLPGAIDKKIIVAVSKRLDGAIRIHSLDYMQTFWLEKWQNEPLEKNQFEWVNYPLGVLECLKKQRFATGGFDMLITGDIPIGAGVSSSAAIECATIFALNELFALLLTKKEMTMIAKQAENEFVGVQCGIMDQFASIYGKSGHLIKLNCDTHEYEYIPFEFPNVTIALMDTKVKHSLALSEYNTRRKECEEGLRQIQRVFPDVKTIPKASKAMARQVITDENIFNRCCYVIEENERIIHAVEDLKRNDLASFGKKMFQTHYGLSKLYEVSCEELDFVVGLCKKQENVIGARMMGAGFGGCVIVLMNRADTYRITGDIVTRYQAKFQITMETFTVELGDGTKLVG